MTKQMRYNKLLLGILLMVMFGFMSCSKSSKPNVIILMTDDQGYGDLSCHNNPTLKTPHLDKLYEESIRLTDFHTSSICTPTRSQLMTGLDAVRNGAYNYGFGKTNIFHSYLDTIGNEHEIHLMSEFFKENGYRTGHFGKWHLGDPYPYASMYRGFDSTLTFPGAAVWQAPNYWNNDCFDDVYLRNGIPEKTEGYNTDVWFSETIKFIENTVKDDQPFFVYLPTSAMHTPQYVPAKYMEAYNHLPPLMAQFFGMIANFDDNYGRLDATLEKLGVKENTILVYLSDNGGTVGVDHFNSGMKGRKCSIYDGGHRVPCFFRWPDGIPANNDIKGMTVVQDILPTLIDLCDLKMPWKQNFDGENLANALKGNKQNLSDRMSVVQFSTQRVGLNGYCVLWNKWRLLDGDKLFNVENDPGQKENVAKQNPDVLKKMQAFYVGWRKGVEPSLAISSSIDIGYPEFETLELTCYDWLELEGKGNPSQQIDIRLGMEMHGGWNLNIREEAEYEFTFRRWPEEADCEITGGLPPFFTEFSKQIGNAKLLDMNQRMFWKSICPGGVHPAGKALPITQIRFTANGYSETLPVSISDKSKRFTLKLPKGQAKLQADFLNEESEILCGAYYVNIKRVK